METLADKEPVLRGVYMGTAEEKKSLLARCAADRDELLKQLYSLYPRFKSRFPAEVVFDIIVDVLDYSVATECLVPGQFAVQSFQQPLLLRNELMADFVDTEGVDFSCAENTLWALMLGHIRLHTEDMLERMNAPGFRESLPPNCVATWDSRQAGESVVYATTLVVPSDRLDKTSAGKALAKARKSGKGMSSEKIWDKIRGLAMELKTIPSAVKLALIDLDWIAEDGAELRLLPR